MADAGEEFYQLFQEAVRLHLISDVPVGVLLSGGLDSSSVLSAMARVDGGTVRTFTVGFDSPTMVASAARRGWLAASVEARVPFLDHRLVEYVTGLPNCLKLRGFEGKRLLRRAMRNVLPRGSRVKQKQAFTAPIDHWLRHPLREMLADTLLSGGCGSEDGSTPAGFG